MSQHQQSLPGPGRGGSVKRAREMLNAGVRVDNTQEGSRGMPSAPAPLRPRPTHRSNSLSSQEAEIEIGYEVEHDPRGPVPILPIQGLPVPKHSGPPPSSRRGPSSVYSRLNASAVSPIPEETLKKSSRKKASYASSTVIPSSWGSGPPVSDILDSYGTENDEPKGKRDSVALLRQASLGKRGKPSLLTFNKPPTEAPLLQEKFNKSSDSSLGYSTVNGLEHRASLDSVSTDSSEDSLDMEKERIAIENEQKSRTLGMGLGLGRPGAGLSSKKPDSHRPPRLDLGAVKAAEAQGSLTSLPDLIRRATKVASNLERGKTASRLGILDMFDIGKNQGGSNDRKSVSLSDILASFPPPRTGTPDESTRNSWPFPSTNNAEKSRLREMQNNSADESNGGRKAGRRFCGMSLPLFIFVCVVVFCIVAAAVVIPVVLVVLPRDKHHSSTSSSAANTTTLSTCEETLPCMNGGVSIETGTKCSCVCVDGYSGTQCGTASDGSCTTTEISESNNATVGSSLPKLFAESETDYNIPLNETDILSLFNANNVTCTVQNALVSIGGLSSKHRRRDSPVEDGDLSVPHVTAVALFERSTATVEPILSVPTDTTTAASTTATTAASAATAAAAAESAAIVTTGTTSAPTTTSTAAASASSSVSASVARIYEFASIAVLYIFEQTQDLDAASTAREDIDDYLLSQMISTSNNMNMSLSMPETFVLSFSNFTITLGNGTVVGGGNGTAA